MIKKFIYRTADVPGGEGGAGLSLAELEALDEKGTENKEPEKVPEKELPPAETDEERIARETKEAEAEKPKPAPEKKEEKPAEDDPENKPDPDDDPDETDEEVDTFLNSVNELRGDEIDVDYGDTDPLSPEGVVKREIAVEDAAIQRFEEYLEQKYPKAFGYLLHTMAGKPDDEYFGKGNLETIPTEEELEASVEVQKQIVISDLIAKGNSEKHAGLILKQLIEDNELEEASKAARTARATAQQAELDAIKADGDKELAIRNTAISEMNTYVEQIVSTGKIGSIEIPVKDRAEFAKRFKESIRYDKGEFMIVSKLTNENIAKAFAREYFDFKNGDLGQIVTAKAKTVNAQRLRASAAEQKRTPKGGAEDKSKVVTLGEIDTD